jgi:hypothetical protein
MNNNTNLTELSHSPDALAQRQAEPLACCAKSVI